MTMVRGSNPIWFLVDLTAHAFDDTFYMFVLENTLPYLPATTWQDPFGNVEWSNPIRFNANGTLPNNIYFEPDKVYRLEFRQGPTQADPLIYPVNNYVPGDDNVIPPEDTSFTTDNQITNPQFAVINFESPLTLTSITSQVIEIAPGWNLNLTGTGNVTLTQVLLNSTVENPTNASYALRIQLSGWDGAYLSQRFEENGVLWSNSFVSCIVQGLSGNPPQYISSSLVDSLGNTITTLLQNVGLTSAFNAFPAVNEIEESINTDFPPDAYIEYRVTLPANCDLTLTSMQLISGDTGEAHPYEQTTIERQKDQTFHYYDPQLKYKPIPSLLTAWDFPLNPFQFGVLGSLSTTPTYIADQTIAATASGSMAWSRISYTGSPSFTSSTNNQAFFIQQYLSGAQAFEMTLSKLAVYLNVYQVTHPGVKCKVYLYYNATGGIIPTLPTNIGTLNADGTFTLTPANNWLAIPQANGFPNGFTLDQLTVANEKVLSGFLGSAYFGSVTTANFAIVVTFLCPSSGTSVVVNAAALMKGDIATPPAPQTPDQVLKECQYYYEKSGGTGLTDSVCFPMTIYVKLPSAGDPATLFMYAAAFCLPYKNIKRAVPLFTTISTFGGATGFFTHRLYYAGVANVIALKENDIAIGDAWSTLIGVNQANFFPTVTPTIDTVTSAVNNNTYNNAYISFQYILDSRLGKV